MNKNYFFSLLLASFTFFLSGCGTAIDNLNAYQQDIIEKAEHMPSQKALAGEKFKVIVMNVEDKGFKVAKSANLGPALTRMLESEIGRDQAIDILDRSVSDKFAQEIQLNEMSGADISENSLLELADFAVVGELKNASFTSRFVQVQYWTDKKGYTHVIPAHYIYTAEVSGQIKIYELPSMKIKKIISFSDNQRRSEDSKFLGRRAYVDNGLVNKAGENAIHSSRLEIKNFLAPKGYVIGARSFDGKKILKISLGSENGAKEGDSIDITTKKNVTDQLTEKTEVELYVIAHGTISNQIQKKSAWILVDDVSDGERVRLGDEAKIVYKKGFSDYMNDAGKLANSFSK